MHIGTPPPVRDTPNGFNGLLCSPELVTPHLHVAKDSSINLDTRVPGGLLTIKVVRCTCLFFMPSTAGGRTLHSSKDLDCYPCNDD